MRLFVKAARRVEPNFAAAAEIAAIVDVCRQVEGLPLAIELAAGWARMLSCRAIADELRHGTELLRAADTRHPPRHASIEAVFEHSWRRLSDVEREALSRLSVFHGGFSIEGAREVAGASLPVLGALADKSLLAKDGDRMHLHPLVQQLAALRLGDEARGPRPRPPTRRTSTAGCASSSRRARAATARRCRRSTATSRTAGAPASSRSPGARARR